MGYKSKDEQRKYQLQWMRRRREAWLQANGPCRKCGSGDRLEIDHINPDDKQRQPRDIWSRRKEIRDAELAKCQVLCEACHMDKTKRDLGLHGIGQYRKGCRCDTCKASRRTSEKRKAARRLL
jgi:5-methylcytosine-specific restriction endonuclease McrA